MIAQLNQMVKRVYEERVSLNTKLKNKRKERGLTQAQVAKQVGITPIGYQRYEAGERVPNAPTAILIADALHVKTYKEFKLLFGAATPGIEERPGGNRAE